MKRINEKVKDIVEVRKFESLRDFGEEAAATLGAYRFTDATSDLMSKWLDRISRLHDGNGAALALAGYRGVGKSHFLATLAAIVGNPDLRTKIGDQHAGASAQALLRRRYPCIQVRRGTRSSLAEELRAAVAAAFGLEEPAVPDRIFDLVVLVRARSGDVPFLVLVDTAMERASRVARDDGEDLAQMAEAVTGAGGLIGVALDDDIAGADGSNAAISRSFSIDYLDQEHLYKIVDSFVFPKKPQSRPALHDVYEYFREVIPSFRWSEQRFSSLYPLHPAILDVAPFVRLYVNDFALLSFAAVAGERIQGRPANSLIALDEVFDSAEAELRKVDDLKEAFEAYDKLNSDVVAKIPVMQRLQAKLILKALLVLSLEGQGASAAEISSGTLIFDENAPDTATTTVEEIIGKFAAAMPDDVHVYSEAGREVRYGLKVSTNDGLKLALETAAAGISEETVSETMHRLFHERFSDSLFFASDGSRREMIEASLSWRGGIRRGRVVWNDYRTDAPDDDQHDWEVVIDVDSSDAPPEKGITDVQRAVWKAADLTADERDAFKRFYVLQHDLSIREQFSEQVRSSFHSHLLVLDRALNRIFFEDGRMTIDGFDYNLSDEARSATAFSSLFSGMLDPLFEGKFAKHPRFPRDLGMAEVYSLASDLYSPPRQKLAEVQQLAQAFAFPLGLVIPSDGIYYPASREHLLTLDPVRSVETILGNAGSATLPLDAIYSELRKPPYGLVREAQHLILAAMVSQRLLEFVTSKGDRINHRSLDLKIVWDDIVGLARPVDSNYSSEKLTKWAKCFSGDAEITDLGQSSDLEAFRAGAQNWLAKWDSDRVLGRFNDVPEESFNTVIWKTVGRTSRTLGTSALLIRKWLEGQASVEECLGRISEAFLDEVERFDTAVVGLETVRTYLEGYAERERIRVYIATASFCVDPVVEAAREETIAALREFGARPCEATDRQVGFSFSNFLQAYSIQYLEAHDSVMRSHSLQEQASEYLASDQWWLFQNLADLAPDNAYVQSATKLLKSVKTLDCDAKTEEILTVSPRCTCGFEIPHRAKWERVVSDLRSAAEDATNSVISEIGSRFSTRQALGQLAEASDNTVLTDLERFFNTDTPPDWTAEHIRALRMLKFAATPSGESRTADDATLPEVELDSAVLSIA